MLLHRKICFSLLSHTITIDILPHICYFLIEDIDFICNDKEGLFMKSTVYILKKLILKLVSLIALSILSLFQFIFSIFMIFYRLLAVPVAVFIFVAMLINYIDVGFDPAQLFFIIIGIGLVGLKYVLPTLFPILNHWNALLKMHLFAPVIVKSPVKFTM